MAKLYYEKDGIQIWHGDCRDVLPTLGPVDLVLTDPPYGIGADSQAFQNSRQRGSAAARSRDYGPASWDAHPPDKETICEVAHAGRNAIIWGGNYFTLWPSAAWLVWDKDNGSNGYADCELAWTNLPIACRRKRYRWMGMLQEHAGDDKEERFHPTQKPLPLMRWCLELVPGGQTVLDPFMGSGTTLRAAKDLGRKAIGIELEEKWCEVAAKRMSQSVLPLYEGWADNGWMVKSGYVEEK